MTYLPPTYMWSVYFPELSGGIIPTRTPLMDRFAQSDDFKRLYAKVKKEPVLYLPLKEVIREQNASLYAEIVEYPKKFEDLWKGCEIIQTAK